MGAVLQNLLGLVSSHTGLSVSEQNFEVFRTKLRGRIKTLGCTEAAYLSLLGNSSPGSMTEWQELAGQLTTTGSYFFRDSGQFALLKNRILPELMERKKQQRVLRIWSAGCATGEEPYSIAILLKELISAREDWQVVVLGSDINGPALENAKRGLYSQWSFRMVEPGLQERYFSKRGDSREIDPSIREMVSFRPCNLVHDIFPAGATELHNFDLILCRNVFIYFNAEAIANVVGKFADTLNDGGYLLTGHGELHLQALKHFSTRICDGLVIFQKASHQGLPRAGSLANQKEKVELSIANPVQGRGAIPGGSGLKMIHVAGKNAATHIQEHQNGKTVDICCALAGMQAELEKGNYAALLEKGVALLLSTTDNFVAHILMARAYANRGEYDDAARSCRKAMAIEATSPHPHFFLAQIAEAMGENAEAKESLKKTLYLDQDYLAAYIELGNIYAMEENVKLAGRMISAASKRLRLLPSGAAVHPYHDTSAGELLRHMEELRGHLGTRR